MWYLSSHSLLSCFLWNYKSVGHLQKFISVAQNVFLCYLSMAVLGTDRSYYFCNTLKYGNRMNTSFLVGTLLQTHVTSASVLLPSPPGSIFPAKTLQTTTSFLSLWNKSQRLWTADHQDLKMLWVAINLNLPFSTFSELKHICLHHSCVFSIV